MDQATPEMRQQATASIRNQVERISEMISEILDFTQGIAVGLGAGRRWITRSLWSQVLEELRSGSGAEVGHAGVGEPAAGGASCSSIPKRLRRVFYNLVHNATDAMPQGAEFILRFRECRTQEVVTEIEDSGPGIAPEIAGQLVRGLRHARQGARHRPGPFHLQADHRGPPGLDLGAQRAGAGRDFPSGCRWCEQLCRTELHECRNEPRQRPHAM